MGLFDFIRRTSFTRFFVSWIISFFIFGILYWIIAIFNNGLVLEGENIVFNGLGLLKGIYASFLIATFFGMQKISYTGFVSIIVYVQLALSIIIVLILFDKLFQKYIVPYHHKVTSKDKKIHTMVLMMSIFRDDINKLRYEFKAKTKHDINIKEIEAIIDGLYVVFLDIEKLFSARNLNRHEIRDAEYMMLTQNIQDSLETLDKFIIFLEAHKIEWKDKHVEFWMRYILETADKIALNIDISGIKSPQVIIAMENIKEYTEKIEKKL